VQLRLIDPPPYGAIATNLVPFRYAVENVPEASGCRFKFWVDGHEARALVRALPGGSLQVLNLVVTSHLLADGPARMIATIETADGEEVSRNTFDMSVSNPGKLAEAVRRSLVKTGKALVTDTPCDTSDYDYADQSLLPWYDRPGAMEHIALRLREGKITEQEAVHLRHFVTNGFIEIDNFIAPELLDEIRAQMDDAVATKYQGYEWGSSQRLIHLHLREGGIKKLWRHPDIIRVLWQIFESEPRSCQTLAFVFGSEQDAHQDAIHLTPFPAGYMCGVWVAIDDVAPDSGELIVYPGSHRLRRATMQQAGCAKVKDNWEEFGQKVLDPWQRDLAASGIEPVIYRPKAGAVLIWHENLLHAGSKRGDMSQSRRSVVVHLFANGVVAFHDSVGETAYVHPVELNRVDRPPPPAIAQRRAISPALRFVHRLFGLRKP
jgi:hypothetical protein